jgi:hypothetical protein
LSTFFLDFLELFFPKVAAYIDPRSVRLMDKEIIFRHARRHVDSLVRARFRGARAFFLIHVENQATSLRDFARRMFRYFAALHEKYGLPVYPIALFSFDKPLRPEADRYEVRFPDLDVLRFRFRAVQLNRLDWRKYLRTPNPVASALMSKMRIALADRPRVRLECLRMLVTLRLDRERSALIGRFMDEYLKLSPAELAAYNHQIDELVPVEKESVVKITNSWIESGAKQGRREGRREGRLAHGREMVLRLLSARFSRLPSGTSERVNLLSLRQLDNLAEAILNFRRPGDLEAWFDKTLSLETR